jgi:RHS repeat-associated protein
VRGTGLGGGIGSVLYSEDASASNQEFFCYNAIGSTVALTDTTGLVTATTDYEAFGKEVASTGSSDNNRKFCTKERDESIGLDNFGFRYFDWELGRFITRDPSGYPDGANNYLYCHNNPINFVDPLGLSWYDGWVSGAWQLTKDISKAVGDSVKKDFNKYWYGPSHIQKALAKGPLTDKELAGVGRNMVRPEKAVVEVIETFRPRPDDIVTGIEETAEGIQNGNIKKIISGTGLIIFGLADTVDVVPDPSDLLQREARKAAKEGSETAVDILKKTEQKTGRTGKQARLKELAKDPKVSSADRGWINQETNAIKRKSKNKAGNKKKHINNPPGKDLAHRRGQEAAKGYGYENADLKTKADHKLQHKYDDKGRKNKPIPKPKEEL